MTIIDVSSGYHNLKLNAKSFYLNTFACQFHMYRFTRLPLGVLPAGDMFQQKIVEISKDLLNVFAIAVNILIVDYDVDGIDHDKMLK